MSCGGNIAAQIPKYSTSVPFGQLHTLSTGSTFTTCKWIFSHPVNFILNILFINATVPGLEAGHICGSNNTNFITINRVNFSNSKVETLQPYCGERELNAIRQHGTVEIELHHNKPVLGVNGVSLTVMIEASLKGIQYCTIFFSLYHIFQP